MEAPQSLGAVKGDDITYNITSKRKFNGSIAGASISWNSNGTAGTVTFNTNTVARTGGKLIDGGASVTCPDVTVENQSFICEAKGSITNTSYRADNFEVYAGETVTYEVASNRPISAFAPSNRHSAGDVSANVTRTYDQPITATATGNNYTNNTTGANGTCPSVSVKKYPVTCSVSPTTATSNSGTVVFTVNADRSFTGTVSNSEGTNPTSSTSWSSSTKNRKFTYNVPNVAGSVSFTLSGLDGTYYEETSCSASMTVNQPTITASNCSISPNTAWAGNNQNLTFYYTLPTFAKNAQYPVEIRRTFNGVTTSQYSATLTTGGAKSQTFAQQKAVGTYTYALYINGIAQSGCSHTVTVNKQPVTCSVTPTSAPLGTTGDVKFSVITPTALPSGLTVSPSARTTSSWNSSTNTTTYTYSYPTTFGKTKYKISGFNTAYYDKSECSAEIDMQKKPAVASIVPNSCTLSKTNMIMGDYGLTTLTYTLSGITTGQNYSVELRENVYPYRYPSSAGRVAYKGTVSTTGEKTIQFNSMAGSATSYIYDLVIDGVLTNCNFKEIVMHDPILSCGGYSSTDRSKKQWGEVTVYVDNKGYGFDPSPEAIPTLNGCTYTGYSSSTFWYDCYAANAYSTSKTFSWSFPDFYNSALKENCSSFTWTTEPKPLHALMANRCSLNSNNEVAGLPDGHQYKTNRFNYTLSGLDNGESYTVKLVQQKGIRTTIILSKTATNGSGYIEFPNPYEMGTYSYYFDIDNVRQSNCTDKLSVNEGVVTYATDMEYYGGKGFVNEYFLLEVAGLDGEEVEPYPTISNCTYIDKTSNYHRYKCQLPSTSGTHTYTVTGLNANVFGKSTDSFTATAKSRELKGTCTIGTFNPGDNATMSFTATEVSQTYSGLTVKQGTSCSSGTTAATNITVTTSDLNRAKSISIGKPPSSGTSATYFLCNGTTKIADCPMTINRPVSISSINFGASSSNYGICWNNTNTVTGSQWKANINNLDYFTGTVTFKPTTNFTRSCTVTNGQVSGSSCSKSGNSVVYNYGSNYQVNTGNSSANVEVSLTGNCSSCRLTEQAVAYVASSHLFRGCECQPDYVGAEQLGDFRTEMDNATKCSNVPAFTANTREQAEAQCNSYYISENMICTLNPSSCDIVNPQGCRI